MAEHPLIGTVFQSFLIEPRITSCTKYSGRGGGVGSVSQAQHGSPRLDQTQDLYLDSLSLKN